MWRFSFYYRLCRGNTRGGNSREKREECESKSDERSASCGSVKFYATPDRSMTRIRRGGVGCILETTGDPKAGSEIAKKRYVKCSFSSHALPGPPPAVVPCTRHAHVVKVHGLG